MAKGWCVMTKVTDEEFKRLIKNNDTLNSAFQTEIQRLDDEGKTRPEGYEEAKRIVLESIKLKVDENTLDFWYETHDFGASEGLRGDMTWANDNQRGDVDWDSCPSKGARNILMGIRADLGGDKARLLKFLDNLPKFLPSGAELSEIERRTDDGRKIEKLNEKIIRAKQEAMNKARKLVNNTDWDNE